jgi:hypothetical protein
MAKALAIASDGSKPLRNTRHERYARLRAAALPRSVAFRKAGNVAKNDNVIDANACRLEKKPGVRERIDYLVRQVQDRIIEKRAMLEEQLWSVMEADPGAFWETYEVAKTNRDGRLETDQEGKTLTLRRQRPKLINDLPLESRKLIEDVAIDRNGNVIPKLYSKAQANAALCKFHNIGRTDDRPESDISRLSDIEIIQQLSDQAKELGVNIDLSYMFHQPTSAASEPTEVNEVIDNDSKTASASASSASAAEPMTARDVAQAKELAVGAAPPVGVRKRNR